MNKRTKEQELAIYKAANSNKISEIAALKECIKLQKETIKNLKTKLKEIDETRSAYKRLQKWSDKQDKLLQQRDSIIRHLVTDFKLPDNFKIVEVE